jgi:putative hemolysin
MTPFLLLQIAVLVLLLACSAFCSSAESAFFSLNPLDVRRITQRNRTRGERVHHILGDPTRLLSAILIGNTIVNTVATVLGYAMAERLAPRYGHVLAIPIMTVLLIIFGEIGPKRIGMLLPCSLATAYLPAITALMWVTSPPRVLFERITRRFHPWLRPQRRALSHEEFETIVDISREHGVINAEELGMVKAVIHLDDVRVSEAMTPRVDMIGIDTNLPPDQWLKIALGAKVNYVVLYRGSLDNIEGLLDVRKYLLDPEHRVEPARRPAFYTHESSPLTRLLMHFQKERQRIAVVVDEYGGTAGLITRGDILEQIAGDVYEEMGKPRPVLQQTGPNRWIVDAGLSIEEVNRKLLLSLTGTESDRLAGWIAERAGHIPSAGDVVEIPGARVTVLQAAKRRVTLAEIQRTEAHP